MKILLHVGMPKCGSSALQAFLSTKKFQRIVKERYTYVALKSDNEVLQGPDLFKKAAYKPDNYVSSHNALAFGKRDDDYVLSQLRELGKTYDTLILSCEGWGQNAHHFVNDQLFSNNEFEVSVLGYVRPQVDWVNSAWWQWGAWSNVAFVNWLDQIRPAAEWGRLMKEWENIPWVSNVSVRLLQGDVVQDFMKTLGYDVPAQPRINQSLPGTLLRVFQRNRQLRPGPHDSTIEFVLAKHLEFEGGKTPWVIRPRLIDELVDFYREDNQKLVAMLPQDMQETMLADQRWWSAEPYANKRFVKPREEDVDYEEMERLLVSSLEAIKKLDARVRKLSRESGDS